MFDFMTYLEVGRRRTRLIHISSKFRSCWRDFFRDKGLCAFDCLIITVQETMSEDEIALAKEALKYELPVCFVRSKCDSDLFNKYQNGEIDSVSRAEIDNHLNYCRFREIFEVDWLNNNFSIIVFPIPDEKIEPAREYENLLRLCPVFTKTNPEPTSRPVPRNRPTPFPLVRSLKV